MQTTIKPLLLLIALFFLAFTSVAQAGTTSYQYDDLHRLKQVQRPDGTVIAYTYDDLGNRTSKVVTPLLPVATAPATITVPATDADGAYTVSWAASTTTGVSYTLEEATNSTFTAGLLEVYSGTNTSTSLSGRSSATTYYYRVKATKTGYTDSTLTLGTNGCLVTLTVAAPGPITAPATDPDGIYTVSWGGFRHPRSYLCPPGGNQQRL